MRCNIVSLYALIPKDRIVFFKEIKGRFEFFKELFKRDPFFF